MRTVASRNIPSRRSGTITGPSPRCWSSRCGTASGTCGPLPLAPDQHLTLLPHQLPLRAVLPPAEGAELGREAPVEPGAAAGVLLVDDQVGDAPAEPAAEPSGHRDRELEVRTRPATG